MKKNILKKLTGLGIALVSTALFGCDDISGYMGSGALTGVQEVTISSTKLNMEIDTTVNCSFDQYFTSDFNPTVENEDLKKWCFTSLMDAHDVGFTDLKASPNTSKTREQSFSFLYKLGFEDYIDLTVGSDATVDVDDKVKMRYSEKNLARKNGQGRHLINVSLCSAATASDWSSNFDVGSNTEGYTGEHPEWKNKDNHKGYDVTANRVIEVLKEELKATYVNNDIYFICLSGYSRGAAVANLVAQKLIDNPSYVREKGFILADYNFACPRTTTSTTCHDAKYNVIHNYINADDLVTYLPPNTERMGFDRYGVDHEFEIQNNQALKERVEVVAKNPYDASCAPEVIEAVKAMTTTRDGLYNIIEDEFHKTWRVRDIDNETEEQAMADYQAFIDEMNAIGLGKYFSFAGLTEDYKFGYIEGEDGDLIPVEDIPYYVWSCYVGDGIVLRVFDTAMTNVFCGHPENATADAYLLKYTNYSDEFGVIVNAIVEHNDFYSDAHFPAAYFCGCFEK